MPKHLFSECVVRQRLCQSGQVTIDHFKLCGSISIWQSITSLFSCTNTEFVVRVECCFHSHFYPINLASSSLNDKFVLNTVFPWVSRVQACMHWMVLTSTISCELVIDRNSKSTLSYQGFIPMDIDNKYFYSVWLGNSVLMHIVLFNSVLFNNFLSGFIGKMLSTSLRSSF